jgi:hypothetical protein
VVREPESNGRRDRPVGKCGLQELDRCSEREAKVSPRSEESAVLYWIISEPLVRYYFPIACLDGSDFLSDRFAATASSGESLHDRRNAALES